MEEWRDVIGFEGFYQVSNEGRVRSVDRYVANSRNGKKTFLRKGIVKKQTKGSAGYLTVTFNRDGKMYTRLVHRLVAEAFCARPNDSCIEVNHIDENKENNHASNLEWCTTLYNLNYGTRTKRAIKKRSYTVFQCSMDGARLRSFPSISEAARAVGGSPSNIMYACRGRFSSMYGYKWELE